MARRRHPYLTKKFWEKNRFWENDLHRNHKEYEERINNIIKSFNVKEDLIFDQDKKN